MGDSVRSITRSRTTADLLLTHRNEILRIAERHGARNVRVFGPVARGDATGKSDIDLLASTTAHTGPCFPKGLIVELQDLLGRKVDVVTEDGFVAGPAVVWIRIGNATRRETLRRFAVVFPDLMAALGRGDTLIEII